MPRFQRSPPHQSVFAGQQRTCAGSVCLGYDPNLLATAQGISRQHSQTVFQSVFVGLAVVFIYLAPVAISVPMKIAFGLLVRGFRKPHFCHNACDFGMFREIDRSCSDSSSFGPGSPKCCIVRAYRQRYSFAAPSRARTTRCMRWCRPSRMRLLLTCSRLLKYRLGGRLALRLAGSLRKRDRWRDDDAG